MFAYLRTSHLTITLPFAIAIHILGIFYIDFVLPDEKQIKPGLLLDITLVNISSKKAPIKADLMAQTNLEASGSSDSKARPMSAVFTPILSSTASDRITKISQPAPISASAIRSTIITTKGKTAKKIPNRQEQPQKNPAKQQKQLDAVTEITQRIAKLEAELGREEVNYNKRPRIRFLDTASAKSAVEAEYIDAWAKKIEAVGNLNFPEDAITRGLNGILILQAILDKGGKLIKVEILSSSGSKILDQSAYEIVEMATPYEPLPTAVSKKWDQLSITRTWVFRGGGSAALKTK
jgi:protein TonB